MKFSIFSTLLLSATTLGAAVPVLEVETVNLDHPNLAKRQLNGIFTTVYEHPNYGGRQAKINVADGICFNLVGENRNWASSARAHPGWTCTFHLWFKCAGTGITVSDTGLSDFYPHGYDNKANSLKCSPV